MIENPCPQSLENQRRQFRTLELFDGREQLKKIQAQTLVGYGKEDIIALPHEVIYLKENINHATLVEFDSGHISIVENQEEVSGALVDFLK